MPVRVLLLIGVSFVSVSCALVTVPVKAVGKAATTTIGVTGKVVGAGFDTVGGGDDDQAQEADEE